MQADCLADPADIFIFLRVRSHYEGGALEWTLVCMLCCETPNLYPTLCSIGEKDRT